MTLSRLGGFTSLLLLLLLAGCKKGGSDKGSAEKPSSEKSNPEKTVVDCEEDLDCYIARARECLPTRVVHSALYPLDWNKPDSEVPMTLLYEVHGWVRGRCHVERIQLYPSWELPDAGPKPEAWSDALRWEYRQQVPFSTALGIHAPRMQCLYPAAQAAGAMERVRDGMAMIEDMAPCYPGDGRCGTLPRFVVGCAYRECLLGRWTFVCEDRGQLHTCEGTRLSDNSSWEKTRCASACGEDGREVLDCDFYWPERRRARLQREAERQRLHPLGPTDSANPAP